MAAANNILKFTVFIDFTVNKKMFVFEVKERVAENDTDIPDSIQF